MWKEIEETECTENKGGINKNMQRERERLMWWEMGGGRSAIITPLSHQDLYSTDAQPPPSPCHFPFSPWSSPAYTHTHTGVHVYLYTFGTYKKKNLKQLKLNN